MSAGKGQGKASPPMSNRVALLDAEVRRLRAVLSRASEALESVAVVVCGLANLVEELRPGSRVAAHARGAVLTLVQLADDLAGERGG